MAVRTTFRRRSGEDCSVSIFIDCGKESASTAANIASDTFSADRASASRPRVWLRGLFSDDEGKIGVAARLLPKDGVREGVRVGVANVFLVSCSHNMENRQHCIGVMSVRCNHYFLVGSVIQLS